jgi:hypothetical protein
MNLFGTVYSCNAVAPITKAAAIGEDHHGKLRSQARHPRSMAVMPILEP